MRRVSLPTSCSSMGRDCYLQELILPSPLRWQPLPPSSLLYRYHYTNSPTTSLLLLCPLTFFGILLQFFRKAFTLASQRRPTATVAINRCLRMSRNKPLSYDLSPECFSSFQLSAAQGISWSDVVNCSVRKKVLWSWLWLLWSTGLSVLGSV